MTVSTAAVTRLVLLGLLGGILQLSAVSQITVFGVSADLTPLLVASAGLPLRLDRPAPPSASGSACSSTSACCRRSASARSRWSPSVTARGASASCATPRTASRRSPSAPPRPSSRPIIFTLLQFLLGVQAPVSLLLVREILLTVVLNTLLALPVYALMRRALLPFLPDDPRRRRRRAYTTGGLSPISRV